MTKQSDLHARLAELRQKDERDEPHIFVGRNQERDAILERAKALPPDAGVGSTVLITGAPGAGKTALAEQAVKELVDDGSERTAVAHLRTDQSRTDGFALFMRQVASALAGQPSPTGPETQTNKSNKVGGGAAGILSGSHESGVSASTLQSPNSCEDIRVLLGGNAPTHPFTRMVVVADEVQGLRLDGSAAEILRELHRQSSLPILTICAGLSDSESVLMEANVSRAVESLKLRLTCLLSAEAERCVRETLQELQGVGLNASQSAVDHWANGLAEASDGWPRHLQTYLREALNALAAQPAPNLDETDFNAVLAAGHESRRGYYGGRVKAGKTPLEAVLALHRAMAASANLSREDALEVIGEAIGELRQSKPTVAQVWDEAFGGSFKACADQMLHAGLFELDGEDNCHSPIPSLSTYIEELAATRGLNGKLGRGSDGDERSP